MIDYLTEITWFLIGYASGCVTFIVLIFWTDLINYLTDLFTFRDIFYKLELKWWEIKFFIRHKVLRK
jgi:hypothetical protein